MIGERMHTKQVLVIRRDLGMRRGKEVAQGAHAALGVFSQNMRTVDIGNGLFECSFTITAIEKEWFENSFTKACVRVDNHAELLNCYTQAKLAGIPCILITDNGTTEFHGVSTDTCVAIGPWDAAEIDKITGGLKLL
jgi:PTH2 family peptidyl-tRNA hydrolase